jgi:hypothetical protein
MGAGAESGVGGAAPPGAWASTAAGIATDPRMSPQPEQTTPESSFGVEQREQFQPLAIQATP